LSHDIEFYETSVENIVVMP